MKHIILSNISKNRLSILVVLFFGLGLLLTCWVYWPGLSGFWLLDDFENLRNLEDIQKDPSFEKITDFIFGGISSSIGRPLSLASFAWQYQSWPLDIESFKYVNLLLHLLNGVLLFWALSKIAKALQLPPQQILFLPLITTLLWLLHPIQVSTVLYVVQRMAQLSTLFILIGVLFYLYGRERLLQINSTKPLLTYFWLSVGITISVLLGLLSKEIGVLLFIYMLVLEKTVFSKLPKPKYWRLWLTIFCYLPISILILYFTIFPNHWLGGYEIREFNLIERLLTEFRALTDYIGILLLPSPKKLGLYFDDFPISRGILEPPSTLFSILFIVILLVTAFKWRRNIPVFSFGVFWFFGGHLLESTVFPVEPYWQHRNYLPSAGILFAVSYYCVTGVQSLRNIALRRTSVILLGVLCVGFILITRQETQLWGSYRWQTAAWATEKPASRRAQEAYAGSLALAGKSTASAQAYQHLVESDPTGSSRYYASLLALGCSDSNVALPDLDKFRHALQTQSFSFGPLVILTRIIALQEDNKCQRLPYDYLLNLLNALIENPKYRPFKSQFYFLLGRLHATAGLLNPAMTALDEATKLAPNRVDIITFQILWLTSAQLYDDALQFVAKGRQANALNGFISSKKYNRELDTWEQKIRSLQQQQNNSSSQP